MSKHKSKRQWIKVADGRWKLVSGEDVPRTKLPRHSGKTMFSLSVHPSQSLEFEKAAHDMGFKSVQFRNGRCTVGSRREEQEYAYYRLGRVNMDGGYYETIRESRMRELRPDLFTTK